MTQLLPMRKQLITIVAGLIPLASGASNIRAGEPTAAWPLNADSQLEAFDLEHGSRVLGERDDFVLSMSALDRQVRIGSAQTVNETAFLKYVSQQAIGWNSDELHRLEKIASRLRSRLADFQLTLPATVGLIKTSGREEAGAPHCRGNAIVLPMPILARPDEPLERLLAHELFHIASRNCRPLRERAYRILNFEPCESLSIPASLSARRMTNPDEPTERYTIELKHEGTSIYVTPLLIWSTATFDPARQRSLFSGIQPRWLEVQLATDGWAAVVKEGQSVLYSFEDLPDLQRQVGRNTDYVIHPEEIMAENFVHLVMETSRLPDPRVVDELREILTTHSLLAE